MLRVTSLFGVVIGILLLEMCIDFSLQLRGLQFMKMI